MLVSIWDDTKQQAPISEKWVGRERFSVGQRRNDAYARSGTKYTREHTQHTPANSETREHRFSSGIDSSFGDWR